MKRINVKFPKVGESATTTIKVDKDKQYEMELSTLDSADPAGHAYQIKFLAGTSDSFPERGNTIYLDSADNTFELANGDILVAES